MAVTFVRAERYDEPNKKVIAYLSADSKDDMTGLTADNIDGFPVGYELKAGSYVITQSMEVGQLGSDGSWAYASGSGGGGEDNQPPTYYGVSTGTKPTDDVEQYSIFIELDTLELYYFDGSDWQVCGGVDPDNNRSVKSVGSGSDNGSEGGGDKSDDTVEPIDEIPEEEPVEEPVEEEMR